MPTTIATTTRRRPRQSAANNPYLAEAKKYWNPARYRKAVECMNAAASDEAGRALFVEYLRAEKAKLAGDRSAEGLGGESTGELGDVAGGPPVEGDELPIVLADRDDTFDARDHEVIAREEAAQQGVAYMASDYWCYE